MSKEEPIVRIRRAELLAELAICALGVNLFFISVIGASPRITAIGILVALGPALIYVRWAATKRRPPSD